MNKQMTSAEIERFTDAYGCGLARTNRRSVMSVKETFTGLDKFDTLLGPNERPYACTGIGAWAAPVTHRNLQTHVRWGGGDAKIAQAHSEEVVGLKPDVILS